MNCRFLHHMEYLPMNFHLKTGLSSVKGWVGQCRNEGCYFTRKVLGKLVPNRTASEPSSGRSPHTKAGVSSSTGTLAPFKGE